MKKWLLGTLASVGTAIVFWSGSWMVDTYKSLAWAEDVQKLREQTMKRFDDMRRQQIITELSRLAAKARLTPDEKAYQKRLELELDMLNK